MARFFRIISTKAEGQFGVRTSVLDENWSSTAVLDLPVASKSDPLALLSIPGGKKKKLNLQPRIEKGASKSNTLGISLMIKCPVEASISCSGRLRVFRLVVVSSYTWTHDSAKLGACRWRDNKQHEKVHRRRRASVWNKLWGWDVYHWIGGGGEGGCAQWPPEALRRSRFFFWVT